MNLKDINMDGLEFIEKENYFIIKRYNKYFRLGIQEANMLKDILKYRDFQNMLFKYKMNETDLVNFLNTLEECGIIGDVKQEKRNILFYRFKLINPDTYLNFIVNKFMKNHIINKLFLIFSILTILLGCSFFISDFFSITSKFLKDFGFSDYVVFYIATVLAIFLHELGHAIACKYFGGRVEEIGFLLIFFSPALYCDVSGIWMFKNKREKIITLIAGIYVQLLIFALCSIAYSLYLNESTWLATFVIWNLLMVFSNILPFIKLDGYWILSNILEIPNLYEKSLKLALGRNNEVLFDEKEISKRRFIKIFGILNISFVFISILMGVISLYYLSITLEGTFKYVLLTFETLTYSLLVVFFGMFLYKLARQKSVNQKG